MKNTQNQLQCLKTNLYVLEFKHVALDKCVLNLLICPRDKQLVIVSRLNRCQQPIGSNLTDIC